MKIDVDKLLVGNWEQRIEEKVMLELGSSATTLDDLTIELKADFEAGEPPNYVCRVSAWDRRREPYCIEMHNRHPHVSLADALARLRRQLQRSSRFRRSVSGQTSAALPIR